MRRKTGQEAIEFILIVTLVFLASIGVVALFGGKIAGFFTEDSAVVKTANNTVSVISPDSQPRFTADYDTKIAYQDLQLGDYNAKLFDSGDIEVNIDGTLFTLPKMATDLNNVAMEAIGTAGAQDLINEIAYLMKTYNVEAEDIEIMYGTGTRKLNAEKCKKSFWSWKCSNTTEDYVGKAKVENVVVNATMIKLNEHVIVLQKDQSCGGTASYCGRYRIEGTYDELSQDFVGNVTSNQGVNGTYSTKVDLTNGVQFKEGNYTQKTNIITPKNKNGFLGGLFGGKKDKVGNNGTWGLNFPEDAFKFILTGNQIASTSNNPKKPSDEPEVIDNSTQNVVDKTEVVNE